VIRSEMPGTLDLPRGRIEKIWDAGKVGQEALAYADVLHNLARYLTGNDTDADDLVQETYARALQAAGQFTPGTNLKAWLFRILRNTFISRYRRERNNPIVGAFETTAPAVTDAEEHWFRNDPELDRLRKVVCRGARGSTHDAVGGRVRGDPPGPRPGAGRAQAEAQRLREAGASVRTTHVAEGAAVKNQSADVSHSPRRIENKRPPATGSTQGANLVDRTISTLATTAP